MRALARSPRVIAILLATAATSFVVAAFFLGFPQSSVALDPRAAACGEVVHGTIKSQTALDQGRDYRALFPKMGYSPELEDSNPAFFVIYDSPTEVLSIFGGYPALNADGTLSELERPAVVERTGVICAITKYGRIIYTDVDTSQ